MPSANFVMTHARILYAPTGTSLPNETSVAWGAAWSGFTEPGDLLDELRITLVSTFSGISPQNANGDTNDYQTGEKLTADSILGDFTGPNIALLIQGTNTTTAAGVSQKPNWKIKGGGRRVVNKYLFGFEGFRQDVNGTLQPVRVFFYIASIRQNGAWRFNKDQKLGAPFTVKAYHDTTKTIGEQLWEIHIVTGPTS